MSREIWTQGFVWVERGRVVGSVSTQPAGSRSTTWVVANVAVHPEHRRRGIAFQLMLATLDFIRRQGAAEAILQVDDDNVAALELYRRLGFTHVATHVTWTRTGRAPVPAHEPSPFDIRPRSGREWLDELNLAELVRPEGLAWNRPLHPVDFRPTVLRRLDQFVNGQAEERWLAVTTQGRVAGALGLLTGLSEGDRLTLLAHPAFRGQVERPLLVRGLRRLGARPWNVRLEHPAGDEEAARTLRDLEFTATRALRWLKKDVR
jgi:RimJ/RimL family protein N-acetyltransferase